MKLSVISFTKNGRRLAERLVERFAERFAECGAGEDVVIYTKGAAAEREGRLQAIPVEQSVEEWAGKQMQKKNALLFIGACGIAVRAIAPHLTDKLHDSPVLVMDERGNYIIPVLSGHVGGANEIAQNIAKSIGAIPVITTATDLNGMFSVDLFAKKNGFLILNKEGIAKVSSRVLAGKPITVSVETGHLPEHCRLPEEVRLVSYPPAGAVDVVITAEAGRFDAALQLKPKEYAVGAGCKKGKDPDEVQAFIGRTLTAAGISEEQCFALASIVQKKEEQAFLRWSRNAGVPFYTYTAEELQEVKGTFHKSSFVKENVGVDNVCERAALKACGPAGTLVCEKRAENGMTIAVARREWSVVFDEE